MNLPNITTGPDFARELLELEVSKAEAACYEARLPWIEKHKAIEAEYKLAIQPELDAIEAAKTKLNDYTNNKWNSHIATLTQKVLQGIPSREEFYEYVVRGLRVWNKCFPDCHACNELTPLKAQYKGKFTVIAFSAGGTSYYGVWDTNGKNIAICGYRKPRHVADDSEVYAEINGQPVAFEIDKYSYCAKKPVSTFFDAVKKLEGV
jgi:hypothetical protein